MDFICPSCFPGRAPVLFVCKKDGSLHLCIDFCGLNKITKKDHYPLPCISDLLDSLCKARFYSKIDLRHTYHLVHICEGDEWKATFHTHYSSFKWHIMVFGLTNAPTTFQHFMNDIFSDLLDVCMLVYLDNILIYSDSEEEHIWHVSRDDLFSTLKASWSFSNSNLGHLWNSLDSNCLPVLETLQSTSYSEPLPESQTLLHAPSTPSPCLTHPLKVAPRPPPPPKVAWRPLWTPHPPI